MKRSLTMPYNLSLNKVRKNFSFNDFNKLILNGAQKILSYGEYVQKKNNNKINRRNVIKYFYKSKL